ncbi:MAG TPA: hypothetical protein VH373_01340 [Jatrophihabitantaceae bacterium]|jgi:hypothetical protein
MTPQHLRQRRADADPSELGRLYPAGARPRRLAITDRARNALARLCRDHGRQALLLSWPGGAATLPLTLYAPGQFDVIIGHVACCPIYADVRQLGGSVTSSAVLDIDPSVWHRKWPLLRLELAAGGPAAARVPAAAR